VCWKNNSVKKAKTAPLTPSQNYHKRIFRPAKVWLLDLKEKHVDQKIMKKNGESNTPFNMSAKDLENNRNDYASGCCGSIFGKSNRAKATGQHTTIFTFFTIFFTIFTFLVRLRAPTRARK